MTRNQRDQYSAHIADTTHAGTDLAGALTDIENLTIAVNAILVVLETEGLISPS